MDEDLERIRAVLVRAVARICPAWLAAERDDIVQDAAIRVARKIDRAQESNPLGSSYLWKVAHSTVMDAIRSRGRRNEVSLDAPHDTAEAPPDVAMREAIREGLATLSPPRRRAVLLYLHGVSLQETATMLGWTAKRAQNQRYDGLNQLRAWLRERGFEP